MDPDEFYPKFSVVRGSTGEKVDPQTCFTLIPSNDPFAVPALEAYAAACEETMPGLARDIRERLITQAGP